VSKCDQLLTGICALSKDIQFDELRKALESYRYVLNASEVEAVITHSEKPNASRLRDQFMNPSKSVSRDGEADCGK